MKTLLDLDGVTAARASGDVDEPPVLTLLAPSGFNESVYFPAESVMVSGIETIRLLRNLCTDLLVAVGAEELGEE